MIPPRLSIVTLGVADLDRSVAFYRALGWEESRASLPGVIVWFLVGTVHLGLFPRAHLAEDASLPNEPPTRFGGITLAINLERAEDVQPALDAAAAAGGSILKAATTADWGGVSGYFADPDGHPWEVAWNPSWEFRPDGTGFMREG
jgi:uncharacterized protein